MRLRSSLFNSKGLAVKISILVTLLATACISGTRYGIQLRNATTAEVREARVSFGDFTFAGGVIPPGLYKRQGLVTTTIPDSASIEWRTADGSKHTKVISLRSAVPRRFSGDVVIDIQNGDEVKVWVKPTQ